MNRTKEYLRDSGLFCAPEKSEHLVLRGRTRDRPPQEMPDPVAGPKWTKLPKVYKLRVIGIVLQKEGVGSATVTQIAYLVRKVARKESYTQGDGHAKNDTGAFDKQNDLRHALPGAEELWKVKAEGTDSRDVHVGAGSPRDGTDKDVPTEVSRHLVLTLKNCGALPGNTTI